MSVARYFRAVRRPGHARRDTGPEHEGGFGLHILDTITTGWGVRTHRAGKTVGADIDAVSRATITITSAARAVRNSARRVARQLLPPPPAQGPP